MKKPPAFLHILFSIYGWIITFSFLMIISLICVFLRIFLPFPKTYFFFRTFSWVMLLLFCPVRITYHPDFKKDGNYVFVQNHVNLLDSFIATRVIEMPFSGLMHKWQRHIPFYGWMMQLSKGIFVDPKKKNNLQNMVTQAKKHKDEGISILTFPEGGRTLTGKCKPFQKGVFVMAAQAQMPVVPISVRGSYSINQKGSKRLWPHNVDVLVGQPVDISNLNRQELVIAIDQIRDKMCQFIEA